MTLITAPPLSPWAVDLAIVSGASHSGAERRALSRDVARGIWLRLGPGMYARAAEYSPLAPESQHVVRMRALAAGSDAPILFSHWSAAVLHRLPVLWTRLATVHSVVTTEAQRHRRDLAQHVFPLRPTELVQVGGLWATDVARTVVDVAAATSLDEGVIAADAVLRRGLARSELELAVEAAGPRRASRRIADAVAFAHPGAESPAESRARVTSYRLGVEVPRLERRFVLHDGTSVFPDQWFPGADAILEIDGLRKYLDPAMAREGAGPAVIAEKRREDELRTMVRAFGRCGWGQSGSTVLLRPVLARIGVHPTQPRTSFREYCAEAAAAGPRRAA